MVDFLAQKSMTEKSEAIDAEIASLHHNLAESIKELRRRTDRAKRPRIDIDGRMSELQKKKQQLIEETAKATASMKKLKTRCSKDQSKIQKAEEKLGKIRADVQKRFTSLTKTLQGVGGPHVAIQKSHTATINSLTAAVARHAKKRAAAATKTRKTTHTELTKLKKACELLSTLMVQPGEDNSVTAVTTDDGMHVEWSIASSANSRSITWRITLDDEGRLVCTPIAHDGMEESGLPLDGETSLQFGGEQGLNFVDLNGNFVYNNDGKDAEDGEDSDTDSSETDG